NLQLSTDVSSIITANDHILIAVPSAYIKDTLQSLPKNALAGKSVISAVKGILPDDNLLLNEYLHKEFGLPLADYFTIMGPCHAEEVAAEKLSYLTFSGLDKERAEQVAKCFTTPYLNTVVND